MILSNDCRMRLARMFCTALVLIACAVLVACGSATSSTPEQDSAQQEARLREAVRDSLSAQLDRYKAPTKEQVEQLMSESGVTSSDVSTDQNIDVADVMSHMLSKFDYELGEVTVDGKKARAQVTVRNVDMNVVRQQAEQRMASDEMRAPLVDAYENEDPQPFVQQSLATIYECIDASTDFVDHQMTLELAETSDGKWEVTTQSLEDLVTSAYGGWSVNSA